MTALVPLRPPEALTSQADSDQQLVQLWLHGRPETTRKAYARDSALFLDFVRKPVREVRLSDVQSYADTLEGKVPATRSRAIAVVKSLLSFGHRIGYLQFDVGRPLRTPKVRDVRAERILSEPDTQRMLALETDARNRVLLRLLYAAGLRVSELCALRRRDLQPREDGGQVTAFGKGGKTRTILLPPSVWKDLESLRADSAGPDSPVFRSRNRGGPLSVSQVWRIVRKAGRRAGIEIDVSPHFLRHAHASHSLDRGAPVSLVAATLGHASVATTGKYLHARPKDSSSRYLAL